MIEQPKYEILRTIDGVELRKYPKLVLVRVEKSDDDDAFGYLFRYITGKNTSNQKIAMIAPVITSEKIAMTAPVISNKNFMAFVLPSKFSMETAPIPSDPAVHLEEIPERILAVIRFSGYARPKQVQHYESQLTLILTQNGIRMIGEPYLMRYNSPFSFGFMRRNEVSIEIDAESI